MTKTGIYVKKFCDMVMNWIKEMSQKVSDFVRTLTTKGLLKELQKYKEIEVEIPNKDFGLVCNIRDIRNMINNHIKIFKSYDIDNMKNITDFDFSIKQELENMNNIMNGFNDLGKNTKCKISKIINSIYEYQFIIGEYKELINILQSKSNKQFVKEHYSDYDSIINTQKKMIDICKKDIHLINKLYTSLIKTTYIAIKNYNTNITIDNKINDLENTTSKPVNNLEENKKIFKELHKKRMDELDHHITKMEDFRKENFDDIRSKITDIDKISSELDDLLKD